MSQPPQYGYDVKGQPGAPPPVMAQPGYPQYGQQQATTTVVINQPGPGTNVRDWSSGMCACFDDMESCLCVSLVPYCYLCCMYQRFNESCMTPCCVPMSDLLLRVQHRNRQKIQGTIMGDCMVTSCCGLCALCQLKRDMDYTEQSGNKLTFY